MLPQVSVAESPPSLLTPRSLEIHFVKLSSLHYTLGPSTSIRHVSDSITFFSFGGALILRIKNIFWHYFEWGWSSTHIQHMYAGCTGILGGFPAVCHRWDLVVHPVFLQMQGIFPFFLSKVCPHTNHSEAFNSFGDDSKDLSYIWYLFPLESRLAPEFKSLLPKKLTLAFFLFT